MHQLKDAAQHHYGSPFRAFLERLTEGLSEVERQVRASRESFLRLHVPSDAAGEVKRAADRFAVIGAAGELATEWGLTGWKQGEATEAAERCFREWMGRRGTSGASDVESGVRQVRAFIGLNGTGRFQAVHNPSRAVSDGHPDAEPDVRDRAGFRRYNAETDEMEYLFLPDTFKDEVCHGYSHQTVLKELDKRGLLIREQPNMTIKPNLPGLGRVRVYCIRAAILEGEEC